MASIAIIAACHMGCRGEVSIGVGHPQWSLWENRLYVDGLSSYCLVSRQCVENSAICTLYQKKFYVRCVIRSGIDLVMCVPWGAMLKLTITTCYEAWQLLQWQSETHCWPSSTWAEAFSGVGFLAAVTLSESGNIFGGPSPALWVTHTDNHLEFGSPPSWSEAL